MRQVKFTQDFDFNLHGGAGGQVFKKEGEVMQCGDEIASKLVSHWEVAQYHDALPSETKPVKPSEWKMEHKGAGYYEIYHGSEMVEKVRGKDKAKARLEELK